MKQIAAFVVFTLACAVFTPIRAVSAQSSCNTVRVSTPDIDFTGNYNGWSLRVDTPDDVDIYNVQTGSTTNLGSVTAGDMFTVNVTTTQLRLSSVSSYTLVMCPAGVTPTTTPTITPTTTPTATPTTPAPISTLDSAPVLPAMTAIADALVSLVGAQSGIFLAALVLLACIFEALWMFLVSRRS